MQHKQIQLAKYSIGKKIASTFNFTYRHICWRLWICLNRDTGFVSWTLIGPCSGRRWKKNKYLKTKTPNLRIIEHVFSADSIPNYRPLRELSTAFSMNSIMVRDLNLAHEPNENVPWSCSIRTWRTQLFNLNVSEKM